MLSRIIIPKCWSIWTILAQLESPCQELSKRVLHVFIAIFLDLLQAQQSCEWVAATGKLLNRRRSHGGSQIIELRNSVASAKLLNRRKFCGGSQIIELRIPWPQPNYWIENFMGTVKLLNWEFRGHSQIIELRISWPLWNYWIENSMVAAKLLNWEFRGLSQIIELRILWPQPNYWIENFVATAKLLNWIGMWLWQWIFPWVCWVPEHVQIHARVTCETWLGDPNPKMEVPKKEIFEKSVLKMFWHLPKMEISINGQLIWLALKN